MVEGSIDISYLVPNAYNDASTSSNDSNEIASDSDSEPDVDRCDEPEEEHDNSILSPQVHPKASPLKETCTHIPKKEADEELITCPFCSFSTHRRFNLDISKGAIHMKTFQRSLKLRGGNCMCLQCGFKCRDVNKLRQYLNRVHCVTFRTEIIHLDNYAGTCKKSYGLVSEYKNL